MAVHFYYCVVAEIIDKHCIIQNPILAVYLRNINIHIRRIRVSISRTRVVFV